MQRQRWGKEVKETRKRNTKCSGTVDYFYFLTRADKPSDLLIPALSVEEQNSVCQGKEIRLFPGWALLAGVLYCMGMWR